MSATPEVHPDDMLHVILDALDALLTVIDDGAKPWADYSASFGGDQDDVADDDRRAMYLATLAEADSAIARRLSASLPL